MSWALITHVGALLRTPQCRIELLAAEADLTLQLATFLPIAHRLTELNLAWLHSLWWQLFSFDCGWLWLCTTVVYVNVLLFCRRLDQLIESYAHIEVSLPHFNILLAWVFCYPLCSLRTLNFFLTCLWGLLYGLSHPLLLNCSELAIYNFDCIVFMSLSGELNFFTLLVKTLIIVFLEWFWNFNSCFV